MTTPNGTLYLYRTSLGLLIRDYVRDIVVPNYNAYITQWFSGTTLTPLLIQNKDIIYGLKSELKQITVCVSVAEDRNDFMAIGLDMPKWRVKISYKIPYSPDGLNDPESFSTAEDIFVDNLRDCITNPDRTIVQPKNNEGDFVLPGNVQFNGIKYSETVGPIYKKSADGQLMYQCIDCYVDAWLSNSRTRYGQI